MPKGFNPGKEMERCKVKHGDVEFLPVLEMIQILAGLPAKRPDLLPLVVLVCFAGLRPSEAARLEWNEIGDDYIRLPGRKSKTGRSRQIPIQANVKLWLELWHKQSGLVCPHTSGRSLSGCEPRSWRSYKPCSRRTGRGWISWKSFRS